MGKAVTPNERLMATLRYLATGRTLEDLKLSCSIVPQTLGKLIPDNCEAIFKALKNYCKNVVLCPNSIGAVDEKHVVTMLPPGSGSYIYKYKNFHSQVLLGIANANDELLYFSFGINGRVSDGGFFDATDLKLEPEFAKGGNCRWKNMRYVLGADDAIPLREYIMKSFSRKVATPSRKIFNYRLCRAHRMIERVFGIIVEIFVRHIVMACCALHNFLRSKAPHQYTSLECLDEEEFESGNATPGPRCNESMSLSKTACHPTNSAELVRESFVQSFNNEGQVSLATK
ncbi:hypothetical protein PR048_032074, partial [Dryococelus australis]